MNTHLRTLGPREAKLVLTLSEQGRHTVTATEVIELLGSKGSARNVIQGLVQKGWLARLVGGRYLFLSPGIGVTVTPSTRLYGYLQAPLYRHVNGVQLTADWSAVLGLTQRF